MRVTDKDLEIAVNRLNKLAGTPLTSYTKLKSSAYKPNARNYHLDWAYGMSRPLTDDELKTFGEAIEASRGVK